MGVWAGGDVAVLSVVVLLSRKFCLKRRNAEALLPYASNPLGQAHFQAIFLLPAHCV